MSISNSIISIITAGIVTISAAFNPVPDHLSGALKYLGISAGTLDNIKCSQLVVVESLGSNGYLSFYEKNSYGAWVKNEDLTATGWVGINGVGQAAEGIATTPAGLYRVGSAFYTRSAPETGLSSFGITPDTYWVDDPYSKYYNRRVVGTADADWSSAEDMFISSYRYGFVIEYNTVNVVPGAGSAFFFHVYGEPTEGCVGTDTATVLAYLKALDASKNPYILIE